MISTDVYMQLGVRLCGDLGALRPGWAAARSCRQGRRRTHAHRGRRWFGPDDAGLGVRVPRLARTGPRSDAHRGPDRVRNRFHRRRHFDIVQASALLAEHGTAEPRWKAASFGEELA
jgi:hypothetical protein